MSKNIVLCFDGTENQFGPLPYTNVLKVFKMLDKTSQSCYYQPGIGVGWHADCSIPNYRHTWKTRAFQKLDAAAGTSFGDHVKAGYKYIIHNYNQGDKIYLFGFRSVKPYDRKCR